MDTNQEELLLQDQWLRRVARALVRDANLAEELVQDAWVAGLGKKRMDRASRPWLRGVMRNRAFSFFRSSNLRNERESDYGESKLAPSTDEVVAQLQIREQVAQVMKNLEEPYRTALYLRFTMGLSLRETGRRIGLVPSSTKMRIETALEQVRAQLDSEHEDDRNAWTLAMTPWARLSMPWFSFPMALVSLFAVTSLAVASIFAIRASDSPPRPDLSILDSPSVEAPSVAGALVAGKSPASIRSVPKLRLRPKLGSTTSLAVATSPLEDEAQIIGRFTLPNGLPAAGATWTLRGSAANSQSVMDHGLPEDWVDPSGALDAEGRLHVAFQSPLAFQYSLTIEHPGHVKVRWRKGSLEPGETIDFGLVPLRAAGKITGSIVDPSGVALGNRSWKVSAHEKADPVGNGMMRIIVNGTSQVGSALFELEGLPAGPVALKIYDKQMGWLAGPVVSVIAGQTVDAQFVIDAVDAFANSVVACVRLQTFHGAPDPDPSRVWLVSPNGDRRHAHRLVHRPSSYIFYDVGPGEFTLEVNDPRTLTWSQGGVKAGDYVEPNLVGGAAVRFDIRSPGGVPMEKYGVDLRFDNATFAPSRYRVVSEGLALPEGLLTGLLPGDSTFTLRHGDAMAIHRVKGLLAGETRNVEIVLQEPRSVTGTVSSSDGEAFPDTLVRIVAPASVGDASDSFIIGPDSFASHQETRRHELSRSITGANGEFELPVLTNGPWLVIAGEEPGPRAECPIVEEPDGSLVPVALTLDYAAQIQGTLALPEDLWTQAWEVIFVRTGPPVLGVPPMTGAPIAPDGSFVFPSIPAGTGILALVQAAHCGNNNGQLPECARQLGSLALTGGSIHTVHYPYPGEPSVPVSFVRPHHGTEPDHVTVAAIRQPTLGLQRLTANGAILGPIPLEPGGYKAWFYGQEWVAQESDIFIPATGPSNIPVALDLSTERVRFMVDGAPFAHGSVALLIQDMQLQIDMPRFQTDGDGWAELCLGPGSYTWRPYVNDANLLFLSTTFEWPLAPETAQVDFE